MVLTSDGHEPGVQTPCGSSPPMILDISSGRQTSVDATPHSLGRRPASLLTASACVAGGHTASVTSALEASVIPGFSFDTWGGEFFGQDCLDMPDTLHL